MHQVAMSKRKWYNGLERVVQCVTKSGTKNGIEWQRVVISANFPFFRIRNESTTQHHRENSSHIEQDHEESLLN